jgi:DNA-binding MarR family transcriptional regulator
VIDRLVEEGYVRRVADPGDRRRVLIEKTKKLEEISGRFYGPLAERAVPLVDKSTAAEIEAIIRFLEIGTELVDRRVAELLEELAEESRR